MLFTVLNNEKKSFSEYIKKFSLDVVFRTFKYEFYGKDENAFEYENGEIVLFLQGYIYNIVDIHSWLGIKYDPKTSHQADVIVHLYKKFGIEYTLNILDGVFSLYLLDQRHTNPEATLYVVGDTLGLQPIFALKQNKVAVIDSNSKFRFVQNRHDDFYCLSTNIEVLTKLRDNLKSETAYKYELTTLSPTRYHKFTMSNKSSCAWKSHNDMSHHPMSYFFDRNVNTFFSIEEIMQNVTRFVISAIHKRLCVHISLDKDILIFIKDDSYETKLIACIVSDYLKICNKSDKLQIHFISKCDGSLKLSRQLHAKTILFLPDEYNTSDFLCRMQSNKNMVCFSEMSIDMQKKGSLMEHDKDIIDNIHITIKKQIRNDDVIMEYPLLDIRWLQYYFSINLDIRENILERSFKSKQFDGKSCQFTL